MPRHIKRPIVTILAMLAFVALHYVHLPGIAVARLKADLQAPAPLFADVGIQALIHAFIVVEFATLIIP